MRFRIQYYLICIFPLSLIIFCDKEDSAINCSYYTSTSENYKKLMRAYTYIEEFKIGTLNDYSSSNLIFINRINNGNSAWCIVNTRNINSSFVLTLELQNFIGINLLDGSSFSIN